MYTNNRYVTIDLYATDADPMQVWISNDGNTGTVVDFSYGKTITITDKNYSIGVALTSSNSTTSSNSNNVLRIVNWPLSSVNGTKKVYAVFRDSYGNKTSVSGLTTITISYNLNGGAGTTPAAVSTVKGLAIYTPSVVPSTTIKAFKGWSTNSSATVANYTANQLATFNANTTLYAIYSNVQVGEYVYYVLDSSASTTIASASSGTSSNQVFSNSSKFGSSTTQKFAIIGVTSNTILISPTTASQIYKLNLKGFTGGNNRNTIVTNILNLYKTSYSSSISQISFNQMNTAKVSSTFSSFFSTLNFWCMDIGSTDASTVFGSNPYTAWNELYWSPEPWHRYYGGYMTGSSEYRLQFLLSENHSYAPGYSNNYETGYYISPVITLTTNVKISGGNGTSSSPYILSIQ